MTAVVITASLDPSWVRPLAALRARGRRLRRGHRRRARHTPAHEAEARAATGGEAGRRPRPPTPPPSGSRALHHALAEYELQGLHDHPGPAARARSWPDDDPRDAILARYAGARAGSRSGSSLLICADPGLVARRRAPRARARRADRLPGRGRRSAASLSGCIGPKVGWGRWTTHLVGAIFAALLMPLLVGWALMPDGRDPPATCSRPRPPAAVEAYVRPDLAQRLVDRASTGITCWCSG